MKTRPAVFEIRAGKIVVTLSSIPGRSGGRGIGDIFPKDSRPHAGWLFLPALPVLRQPRKDYEK